MSKPYVTLDKIELTYICVCDTDANELYEYLLKVPKKFKIHEMNICGKIKKGKTAYIKDIHKRLQEALIKILEEVPYCNETKKKGAWCHNDGDMEYDSDKWLK